MNSLRITLDSAQVKHQLKVLRRSQGLPLSTEKAWYTESRFCLGAQAEPEHNLRFNTELRFCQKHKYASSRFKNKSRFVSEHGSGFRHHIVLIKGTSKYN